MGRHLSALASGLEIVVIPPTQMPIPCGDVMIPYATVRETIGEVDPSFPDDRSQVNITTHSPSLEDCASHNIT